jgi:hypothetical protein
MHHATAQIKYSVITPEDQFILSISKGELWFVSSIQEVCLHVTISVPPSDVDKIRVFSRVLILTDKTRQYLDKRTCQWIDNAKASNLSTDQVHFLGCTSSLDADVTANDILGIKGILDFKLRHKRTTKRIWSREKHVFPRRKLRFSRVIDTPVVNFCNNLTVSNNCPKQCYMTCMDLISGQDLLFCDTSWGSSQDVKFLGTGSPEYDATYIPNTNKNLQTVINADLYMSGNISHPHDIDKVMGENVQFEEKDAEEDYGEIDDNTAEKKEDGGRESMQLSSYTLFERGHGNISCPCLPLIFVLILLGIVFV